MILSQRIAEAPGAIIRRTTRGTLIEPLATASGAPASSRVRQYLLTDATFGDYFVCRTLAVDADQNLTIGATDIFIAKPFALRQSPFDRDVLNVDDPGNIGTVDEITYDIEVESWDGATLNVATQRLSHEYKSATFRLVSDVTDIDAVKSDQQTIVPRFVPAVLNEDDTTDTISPTIIYAIECAGLGLATDDDAATTITLLALEDTWAWMEVKR